MRKHRRTTTKLLLATIVLMVGIGLTSYAEENPEVKAAVQRATDAGAGSYQDQYISGGWKTVNNIEFLRAFKDENGMIISPTSGIISKAQGKYAYYENPCGGGDKSITLKNEPPFDNLQPNWIYNPLGKTISAPPIICMDKNIYYSIGWDLGCWDKEGDMMTRMDTCDTSGSWIYTPNPTGSADYCGLGGQLSGWMYRYADGSYAANGISYIYDGSADDTADHKGAYVSGSAFMFNENGFLITNSAKSSTYLDEYGRVCDGTAGAFGTLWYYTR